MEMRTEIRNLKEIKKHIRQAEIIIARCFGGENGCWGIEDDELRAMFLELVDMQRMIAERIQKSKNRE